MRTHVTVLGWLYIGLGLLGLLAAALVLGVGALVSFLAAGGDGFLTMGILGIVATIAAALALPNLIVGIGLLQRAGWARVGGLILGFLNLFNPPLGTVLGIYTFWVLLSHDGRALFV
ncbi:MAG: hypothetical protein WEB88_00365 [Gemmatimonadota bacterium]